MTLVIMAAGMGSRFGGLKQIEPVHENGEFILDYSIYDAIKCGFNKIVFVIKEENYNTFRETIGKRIESMIDVEYVFQNNDNVPTWIKIPNERVKPLGTGHAILCCKKAVTEKFVIINSDDFYGRHAFEVAAKYMKATTLENEFAMIGYITGNTLTENGAVKRGICKEKNGYLTNIVESSVELINDKIIATPLDGSEKFHVQKDALVSMNMFIFTPKIFDILEKEFNNFLINNKEDLSTCEYLIPDVVCKNIINNNINVKVLKTISKWQGITYKEDKKTLVKGINELIKKDEYLKDLWN